MDSAASTTISAAHAAAHHNFTCRLVRTRVIVAILRAFQRGHYRQPRERHRETTKIFECVVSAR
jgi:hypothetical protein